MHGLFYCLIKVLSCLFVIVKEIGLDVFATIFNKYILIYSMDSYELIKSSGNTKSLFLSWKFWEISSRKANKLFW